MKATWLLPVAMMVSSTGACIAYAFASDWRRATYWAAATVITAAVTF